MVVIILNRDLYEKLLQTSGITTRDRTINNLKQDITFYIKDNPSYKNVLVNDTNSQWLSLKKTDFDNKKRFNTIPNEIINIGDSVQWNGTHWFVTSVDFDDDITRCGEIQQCNRTIKWQNPDTLETIERWCFCDDPYSSGINKDNAIVTTLDGKYKIQIPYDDETKNVNIGKRIMLDIIGGIPNIFKIDFVNANTNKFSDVDGGFITWTLSSDEYNPNTDNKELMLCDYIDNSNNQSSGNRSYISGRNVIKIGNTRVLTSVFYNDENTEMKDITPKWSYNLPEGFESDFEIVQSNQHISISCSTNENLIGHTIQLTLSDENNIYSEYKMTLKVGDVFG